MKYTTIVIVGFTVFVFLNLLDYFTLIHIINFPSYFAYFIILGLMIIYYITQKKKIYLNKGLLLWVILYFVINTIYLMQSGMGGMEYKFYIPSVVWLLAFITMSLLYNLDTDNLTVTRRSIVIALLIGVLLLLYDFTHPGFFTADYVVNFDNNGRAVATYGNQNAVGAIFILGLVLTIDIIPNKFKYLYIVILFVGVLTTVSRSNIMIYFIILTIMAIQNKISRVATVWLLSIITLLIFWLALFGLDILREEFNIEFSESVTSRLEFFVDTKHSDTSDTNERQAVLKTALYMFADKPIFGNGIGSSRLWKYKVGPHNTFALTWADFGLIGVLIIPSFLFFTIYETIRSSRKEDRDIAILFIFYFTFSSFFSHNMLEQVFNLCGAVIIATLGIKNKLYKEN